MDQEAFRQLVSTSSAVAGSSRSRAFGKAHKRHPASSTASSSSSTKPSDLKPRKLKPNGHSDGTSSTYFDRASARRSGAPDSEFSDIEALHRDFEERIAAAETEEERQRLRDQISSVGGDAKYSVLVKGLDWALLAQNKARLERESGTAGGGGEGEEGDLESAFQEGRADRDTGKRSRDDIVEAIKRRREEKSAVTVSPSTSGFRPIGFKPVGGADKAEADGAEYKWVNGKRMRKKKKIGSVAEQSTLKTDQSMKPMDAVKSDLIGQKAQETAPSLDVAKVSVKHPSIADNDPPVQAKQHNTLPVSESEAATHNIAASSHTTSENPATSLNPTPPAHRPLQQANDDDDDDDDEDIFADVGGWDGIPEAKEDDDEERISEEGAFQPAPVTPPPTTAVRSPTPPPPLAAAPPSPQAPISTPSTENDHAILDTAAETEPSSEPHPLSVPASMPATASSTEPLAAHEPKPNPKKSKWDDDLDDGKKKKKKKHR
ncbi:hypothetical protein EX895_005327 [Sporisorium graminicola]|uniref:RED-like N-terminal domain-containing protein n=1 Tax=Sporisorium graminicola TaxID=280036 RepID=A0A4U7KPL7_9BASI|nr:hypothetical protein EX895_005327 [Sporisorium graminicola]TKY85787.1 hypothetical protein EX895_005327 [Sporisorium graminicola]